MVKLKGPLLSLTAHGKIADVLTFARRKARNIVRYQRGQKDYLSAARVNPRAYYSTSCGWWNQLSSSEQAEWEVVSRGEN